MQKMSEKEALQDIQFLARRYNDLDQLNYSVKQESLDMAIKALEELSLYKQGGLMLIPADVYQRQCDELDAYKAIGTVEEVQADKFKMVLKRHGSLSNMVDALEEYHTIGSEDQCRETVERMKPKKPHKYVAFDGIERNGCPRCYEERGRNEILYAGQKYCSVCAQAIDRSE